MSRTKTQGNRRAFVVAMPDSMRRRIEAIAKAQYCCMSSIVLRAVDKYLAGEEQDGQQEE